MLDNESLEPTGIFSLHTSIGPIVLIFSNPSKRGAFFERVSVLLAPSGDRVGWIDLDGSSITDVVYKLKSMDPTLEGEANFIHDNDPLFDQLLSSLPTE